MTTISPQYFNNIAQFLNTSVGKISKENNLFVRSTKTQSSVGTINIIFALLKESKQANFGPKDVLEETLVYQWLEYAILQAGNADSSQNIHSVLKDLNNILATKTYLLANRLTVADAFLYFVLLNAVAGLSNSDKERYLNVSRWFNNLQQNPAIRQKNKIVDFSTIYLSSIVSAKH